MSNKILPVLSVFAATIIIAFSVYVVGKNRTDGIKVTETGQTTPTPTPETLVDHQDQADFRLKYPSGLSLDTHPEDKDNYAHLELTSADASGSMVVLVKDFPYKDITAWLAKNSFENALDSKLDGYMAKKILDRESGKIIVALEYGGYLYQLEYPNTVFWNEVSSKIISSFSFTTPDEEADSGYEDSTSVVEEASYDEEEVLE